MLAWLPSATCIRHAVKPGTEVNVEKANCTWNDFCTSKYMTTLRRKKAAVMHRTSQADIQRWMWGQVELSRWFILHPLKKLPSGYPIKRCQRVSSLSSSGLQTLPFMWQASQLTWLLLYTGLFTFDLLLKLTPNGNWNHIPRAFRV